MVELPPLLRGIPIPLRKDDGSKMPLLGTQHFKRSPVAVLVGGGYNNEMLQAMRGACLEVSKVPWLHHDWQTHAAQGGPNVIGAGYVESVIERVKTRLRELHEGGKMGMDGVHKY